MPEKVWMYGQNNPPLGWHICTDETPPYTAICGLEFDLSGRIYGESIKLSYVDCEECRSKYVDLLGQAMGQLRAEDFDEVLKELEKRKPDNGSNT